MLHNNFKHQAFGTIKQLLDKKTHLHGSFTNGSFEFVPYSNNIIRISYSLAQSIQYKSYATVIEPAKDVLFQLLDNKDYYNYQGENFDIIIHKKTGSLKFIDKQKSIINQDDTTLNLSSIGYELYNYKKLFDDEKFIGLGEKVGDLNRRGKCFINKNSDTFAYGIDTDPIYSSIPFYIGLHSQNQQYGIFLDNTSISTFSFGVSNNRNMFLSAENGTIDYYFIYDKHITNIIEHYTKITGKMEMPPLWSLGFHQSRYSYYPEFKLDEVVKGFEDRDIPLDAIHFDIHYMEAFKAFTWDKEKFPKPAKTITDLSNKGIQSIAILDPGIKVEKGYHAYESGLQTKAFASYPDGQLYTGSVWPGVCHFPDFTNVKVRKWWAQLCNDFYIKHGFKGLWNDMNEPAVWGQKFPDYIQFHNEGDTTSFRDIRNAYGLLMTRATAEGFEIKHPNQRKFLLTRAAYAGIQRYSAKWTGDNVASEEHMFLGIRLVNSLGISGVAFSGVDIGGFVADVEQQLFARWIAVGCFLPFFRAHKMINSRSSEPWHFGEVVEQIAKNYIQLRYRLIPYLYKYFYRAAQTGLPINSPLALEHPFNEKVYEPVYQHQFLFGDDFLICPIGTKDNYVKIYLPPNDGGWYDFYTDQLYDADQEIIWQTEREIIPVFIKAGSIIALQKVCKNLTKDISTQLEWHVYPNQYKDISTTHYEDDGNSNDWTKKAKYLKQNISFDPDRATLTINTLHNEFISRFKSTELYIHAFASATVKVIKDKKEKKYNLQETKYSIVDSIPNFDPFSNEAKGLKQVNVLKILI